MVHYSKCHKWYLITSIHVNIYMDFMFGNNRFVPLLLLNMSYALSGNNNNGGHCSILKLIMKCIEKRCIAKEL